MNGDKNKSNDLIFMSDPPRDIFGNIFGEEKEDPRPETYRENYFDMEASFPELSSIFGNPKADDITAIEQWLDTYAPQTVVEKFQPSFTDDFLDAAKQKDMQNYLQDLYEQVTPDSMSQRREMTKEYFSNIARLNNVDSRVMNIDFDNIESEALDAFNGLAIVQNMIEANKSEVVGGDPMLPGMPSELDGTPINPRLEEFDLESQINKDREKAGLPLIGSNDIQFQSNPGERDILERTGIMLPKGTRKEMAEKRQARKEKFDEEMSKMSFKDRIINFFRTDSSQDRLLQNNLINFLKDLDFRQRNPERDLQGNYPLKAEYQQALDKLITEARLGQRG